MDFSRVKALTIPEGNANKITINGVNVWEKKIVETILPITLVGSSYSHNTTNYSLCNLYLTYYQLNAGSSTKESMYTRASALSTNITANISRNLKFTGQLAGKSSSYKGKFKITLAGRGSTQTLLETSYLPTNQLDFSLDLSQYLEYQGKILHDAVIRRTYTGTTSGLLCTIGITLNYVSQEDPFTGSFESEPTPELGETITFEFQGDRCYMDVMSSSYRLDISNKTDTHIDFDVDYGTLSMDYSNGNYTITYDEDFAATYIYESEGATLALTKVS